MRRASVGPPASDTQSFSRLQTVERTMVQVRWGAVVFGLIQAFTFYRPYPAGMEQLAVGVMIFAALGNIYFWRATREAIEPREQHRFAIASLAFDFVVIETLVFVYTFDPVTSIWAVMYILPLEAAARFQRRGALYVTLASAVVYICREIFGYFVYNNEFLPTSISFRMGIDLIIALIIGKTANSLLFERRVVEATNRDLEEMNASIRNFVAIASHDMRTPIAVISGGAEFMTDHWDEVSDDQKRELVGAINRQAHSLERLVNDLLTSSRIEAGTVEVRPEPISVQVIAKDVLQFAPVTIDVALPGLGETRVLADPEHVRRILLNFVVNAHKYGAAPIELRVDTAGDVVDISVRDAGPGVPAEFVPLLFDSFTRGAREHTQDQEGSGLGLAIVKGLAELNNGSVRYESNTPSGAAFHLTLPRALAAENQ